MRVIQVLSKNQNRDGREKNLNLINFFKSDKNLQQIENIILGPDKAVDYLLKKRKIKSYKIDIEKVFPFFLLAIPKVSKAILKDNPDIIHARSPNSAWVSFFASRNKNCCFLTTIDQTYKKGFFGEVVSWGKFVICSSGVMARRIKQDYEIPEEKIIIIPPWVDLDKFKFVDGKTRLKTNYIVGVGRAIPSGGHEHLIKAFRKIVRFRPYLKLRIVVLPDSLERYLNRLKTLVNRFSLNYSVEFLNSEDDYGRILSQAKVLVAPSLLPEPSGQVVLEAAASGVPVVATKVGAFYELINDQKDGLLVPPADFESLADSILKIIENPSLAQQYSMQARQKVERFYTRGNYSSNLEAAYCKSISQKRILVIKLSSFGDLILIIPFLAQLRKDFPQAKIHLMTLKKYSNLFYDCPYVDKIITVGPTYKKIKEVLKVSKRLRRISFDYIVDLQNNRSSQLISFLSFPQQSFGFRRKLGFLLKNKAVYIKGEKINPLESQEKILSLLGLKFDQKKLIFWKTKPLKLDQFSLENKKYIGISLAASVHWHTKNWPVKNMVKFIKLFLKEFSDYHIVFVGDKLSRARSTEIKTLCKTKKVIDLCGKTKIRELVEVLKNAEAFIAPDTATLHLAQSLGINTVGLFGPTNPKRHSVEADNLYIIDKNLPCSYCYRKNCKLHSCLKDILPREVLSKIKSILKKSDKIN